MDSLTLSLVAQSYCGNVNGESLIRKDDALLQILLARFTSHLTRYQRHDFGNILHLLQNHYRDSKKSDNSNLRKDNLRLTIPICDSAIRKMYLCGKNSIMKNLPNPKVNEYKDHSMISIRSCISDFLRSGRRPKEPKRSYSSNDTVSSIYECHRAHEILNRANEIYSNYESKDYLVVLGILWSDDFDPNTSIKSNRGSVWIKTLTFVSDNVNKNDDKDTYPIAIGLKSNEHEDVEKIVCEGVK